MDVKPNVWAWASSGKGKYDREEHQVSKPHPHSRYLQGSYPESHTRTTTPCCSDDSDTNQAVVVKPNVWAWASSGKGKYDREDDVRPPPHHTSPHPRGLGREDADTNQVVDVKPNVWAWASSGKGKYDREDDIRRRRIIPPRTPVVWAEKTPTPTKLWM